MVIAAIAPALGGCGGAAHAGLASTTTITTPSTSTPTPARKPTPKSNAAPHAKRPHGQSQPPGNGSETVETVTSDGSVLVLDNGDTSEDASSQKRQWAALHMTRADRRINQLALSLFLDLAFVFGDADTSRTVSAQPAPRSRSARTGRTGTRSSPLSGPRLAWSI
jgi:hypothetical protein